MVIFCPPVSNSFNKPSVEAVAITPTSAVLIAAATSETEFNPLTAIAVPFTSNEAFVASLSKFKSKNNVVDAVALTPL